MKAQDYKAAEREFSQVLKSVDEQHASYNRVVSYLGLAKVLTDFAKKNPQVEVFAGVVDGQQAIDSGGVKQLSELPTLPELQAQLLSLINTPATTLVRLISTPGSQIARVVDARREELAGGEA